MPVWRLPLHSKGPPGPPQLSYAPHGFGGDYNWLCQKPLPFIDNYRTSTGVGLYYVHPISERYDRVRRPLPCALASRDPAAEWDLHLTTTGLAHDPKSLTKAKDPATFAGNYASDATYISRAPDSYLVTGKMKLIRKFDEHIRHRPHNRGNTCPSASVSNSTCGRSDVLPSATWGKLHDLTPATECKVRSDCLDVQPFIAPEAGGYVRLLDPLVSTTTMDFHAHSERKQCDAVGAKNVITYWDAEGYPRAQGWGFGPRQSVGARIGPGAGQGLLPARSDPDPVYDKEQFAHRAVQRRLPTRVTAVPHKGLQSEQQDKFRQPLDDFVSHRWGTGGVEYPLAVYPNTATELLTAPGAYCPESAHYGTRIPVKAVVDTGAAVPQPPFQLVRCKGYPSGPTLALPPAVYIKTSA